MPNPTMHGTGCCGCGGGGDTVASCECPAVPTILHATVKDEEASDPWYIDSGFCFDDAAPSPFPQRSITLTYRAKVGTDPGVLPSFFWASECVDNAGSASCHCAAVNSPDAFGATIEGTCSLRYYLFCDATTLKWRFRVAGWSQSGCTGTLESVSDQYGTTGINATSCSPFVVGSTGQLVTE